MQTSDLQVLQVMSAKKGMTSARIAEKLSLTPFQITARLASMEKRGLTKRADGLWVKLMTVEQAKGLQIDKTKTDRRSLIVNADDATLRRDTKAATVTHTRGWKHRYFWMSGDRRVIVFTTLDGKHYTYAEPSEPADLLVDFRERKIGVVRLHKFDSSSAIYRRLYKEQGRALTDLGFAA